MATQESYSDLGDMLEQGCIALPPSALVRYNLLATPGDRYLHLQTYPSQGTAHMSIKVTAEHSQVGLQWQQHTLLLNIIFQCLCRLYLINSSD